MRRPATVAVLVLLAACEREPAQAPAPAAQAPAPSGPASPAATPFEPPHPVYDPAPNWGEPDTPKVRRLFEERFPEVRRCYEAELQKHPRSTGKLTLKFTIVESGALRHVTVAKSTFKRPAVPSCVQQVVRRWKTPFHPDEPVAVEYPLSFLPR